jgi:hypothetical protein
MPTIGRGIFSLLLCRPLIAEDERRWCSQAASIAKLPAAARQKSSQTFHAFARLPYELRRQIWIELLSQETPRSYELELHVRNRYSPQPVEVDFAPGAPPRNIKGRRDLVNATATSRTIGSTCREARDALTFVLPDKFQMKANPRHSPSTTQRLHLSAGSFRFNAARDIITVLCSSTSDLRFALEWSSGGSSVEMFGIIQNLAFDTAFMEDVLLPWVWSECGCCKPGCRSCLVDPLQNFLRLFPRLKSFHIAQATSLFMRDEQSSEHVVGLGRTCHCDSTAQGTKHDWPLFKGMADDAWYISYLEDSGCPFPTLPRLAHDRELYASRWPYYGALSNLDIRILRRVTLQDRKSGYALISFQETSSP